MLFQFNLRCQSQFRPLYHRLDPIYPILGFRPYSRILDGGQDPPLGPAMSVSPLSHALFAHWASKEGPENYLHKNTKKHPYKKVPILGPCWRPEWPKRSIVANSAPKTTPKWSPNRSQKWYKKGVCSKIRQSQFGTLFTTLEPCRPPRKELLLGKMFGCFFAYF